MKEHFLYVEKYRPQSIEECILPVRYKETFQQFVDKGEFPNMLLSGGPGIGKTTVAKALCNELGLDVMVINASENGNIDTLRTQIRQFASTVSLMKKLKVVILDEADYLNANSTQPALRNFMEEFSRNCRFILTANFANRIIEPLHSRCTSIEFNITKKEYGKIASQFMKRCEGILDKEGVKYAPDALAEIIKKYFPDFRKVLNELQRLSYAGSIEASSIDALSEVEVEKLLGYLKEKEFTKARKWVSEHAENDPVKIMRNIIDRTDLFEKQSIPNAILIYNEHDYKNAFVADKELNLMAFITTLMLECEFA
jgi:DNA polymerase III delta prime subunit